MFNEGKEIVKFLEEKRELIEKKCYYPDDVLNSEDLIKLMDYIILLEAEVDSRTNFYKNTKELYLKILDRVKQLEEENNQLKDECYKKRNDNKSLRGTLKATLETSNNRHKEIKRLLKKIEKLETTVDSDNSTITKLSNRIIKAIELINLELSQRQSNISLHAQVLLIEIKSILERGKE